MMFLVLGQYYKGLLCMFIGYVENRYKIQYGPTPLINVLRSTFFNHPASTKPLTTSNDHRTD